MNENIVFNENGREKPFELRMQWSAVVVTSNNTRRYINLPNFEM